MLEKAAPHSPMKLGNQAPGRHQEMAGLTHVGLWSFLAKVSWKVN